MERSTRNESGKRGRRHKQSEGGNEDIIEDNATQRMGIKDEFTSL